MEYYRIKIGGKITYQETEYTTNGAKVIGWNTWHKTWRMDLVKFIRRNYQNVNIRDIANGTYKVISNQGFLIGVQFDMNKLSKN